MKVEIYRLKEGGSQEIIATCNLVDEKVVCQGDEKFIGLLSREGILDRNTKPPRKIFPRDGVIFLRGLLDNFKSGYLVASDVPENNSTSTK